MDQNKFQTHLQKMLSTYHEKIEIQNEIGLKFIEAAISHDFKYLVTTHIKKTKTLIIKDLHTDEIIKQEELPDKWGKMILFQFSKSNKEFLYSQGQGNTITIFNLNDRKSKIHVIEDKLLQVKITSDGLIVCSISFDSKISQFWNLQNGKQIKQLQHAQIVECVHFWKNDTQLITISVDEENTYYTVWDVEKQQQIKQWNFQLINPHCDILLNEKEDLLIVRFFDEEVDVIQIWSLITFELVKTIESINELMIVNNIFGNLIVATAEEGGEEDLDNELFQSGKLIVSIFDMLTEQKSTFATYLDEGDDFFVMRNAIIGGKSHQQKMSKFYIYK